MRARHALDGYGDRIAAMSFVLWAQSLRAFPTPQQVMDRFDCARATAHRWLNQYEVASGKCRPRRDSWGNVRAAE